MREVTTYYAFDDTEFDVREECIEYESKGRDYCCEFIKAYDFYDKDKQHIDIPATDADRMLSDIEEAYSKSEYVRVYDLLDDALEFIYQQLGLDLPHEVGYFKYDFYGKHGGGWYKVDE